MRELRTRARVEASATRSRIEWAVSTGRWTLIIRGVYGRGPEAPSELDIGRATALVTGGVAHGLLAGELHNFDGVKCVAPEVWVPRSANADREGVRRRSKMPTDTVEIGGVMCTTAADTLIELTSRLDDDRWEQALEFCLRKKHVTREPIDAWPRGTSDAARRVRRVIRARAGLEIPHTDSLLETLAIQLIRRAGLPTPVRQHPVRDRSGRVVARLDLAWPALGIFVELDGQQHRDQPVYDARRQTLATAITGWRCGRLTWNDVVGQPTWGEQQLVELLACPNSLVS
jgi:very-short-patch-repair endonuclease